MVTPSPTSVSKFDSWSPTCSSDEEDTSTTTTTTTTSSNTSDTSTSTTAVVTVDGCTDDISNDVIILTESETTASTSLSTYDTPSTTVTTVTTSTTDNSTNSNDVVVNSPDSASSTHSVTGSRSKKEDDVERNKSSTSTPGIVTTGNTTASTYLTDDNKSNSRQWFAKHWSTHLQHSKIPSTVRHLEQQKWWTTNDIIITTATRSSSSVIPTGANRLICRCLRYFHGKWDLPYTKRVLQSYLQFLLLKHKAADWYDELIDCPRMSSIYLMWQIHVSDTNHYKEDCLLCFNHHIDHTPDDTNRKRRHIERVHSHVDRMKYTLLQLLQTFEECDIDQGIWMIGNGTSIVLHHRYPTTTSYSSWVSALVDKNDTNYSISIPKINRWWIDGGPRNVQFSYPNPNLQTWWLFDASDEHRNYDDQNETDAVDNTNENGIDHGAGNGNDERDANDSDNDTAAGSINDLVNIVSNGIAPDTANDSSTTGSIVNGNATAVTDGSTITNTNDSKLNVSNVDNFVDDSSSNPGHVTTVSGLSALSSESFDSLTYTLSGNDGNLQTNRSVGVSSVLEARGLSMASHQSTRNNTEYKNNNRTKNGTATIGSDNGMSDDEVTLFGEQIDLISDDGSLSTNGSRSTDSSTVAGVQIHRLTTINDWVGIVSPSAVRQPRSARRRMNSLKATTIPVIGGSRSSSSSPSNHLLPCNDDILNELYVLHQQNEAVHAAETFFDKIQNPNSNSISPAAGQHQQQQQQHVVDDVSGGRHMLAPISPYFLPRSPQGTLFVDPELPATLPGSRSYHRRSPPTTPTESTLSTTPDSKATDTSIDLDNMNNTTTITDDTNNIRTPDNGTPIPQYDAQHTPSPTGCCKILKRMMFEG